MANLVLAFLEVGLGAIILDAGIKGDSLAAVIKGQATQNPISGLTSGTTPAGGSTSSGTTPAGKVVNAANAVVGKLFHVTASQESDGGAGACGPIGSGGMWYSELSTVPQGTGSDFAALGHIPCGTPMKITNPANGRSVIAYKRDVGAGSSFLPVMGLYPAVTAALGLGGGEYHVIIGRADGQNIQPARGTPA